MKKAIISFAISLVLGFGLGYLVFDVIMGDSGKTEVAKPQNTDNASTTTKDNSTDSKETAATTTAVDQDNIL